MKKYFFLILQFMVLSAVMLLAQDRMSFFNDRIVFYAPEGTVKALLVEENEFFSGLGPEKYEEYKKYYANNKISISTTIEDVDYYANITEYDYLAYYDMSEVLQDLAKSGKFNHREILLLLSQPKNQSGSFTLGRGMRKSTYSFIEHNGEIIGETYAKDASVQGAIPYSYGYIISFVIDDYIAHIRIRLHDEDLILPPKMQEYFYYRNEDYYVWHDYDLSRNVLYQKLEDADYEGLPEVFQRLRETRDMVLDTLVIKGYEESDKAGTGIRLINAGLSSPVVTPMPKDVEDDLNKNVVIEDEIKVIEPINENNALLPIITEDTGINKSRKTWNWLFLLLLIPLIVFSVFLVVKKRK